MTLMEMHTELEILHNHRVHVVMGTKWIASSESGYYNSLRIFLLLKNGHIFIVLHLCCYSNASSVRLKGRIYTFQLQKEADLLRTKREISFF